MYKDTCTMILPFDTQTTPTSTTSTNHNLDLHLLTTSTPIEKPDEDQSTQLQLSIGSSYFCEKNENLSRNVMVSRLKDEAREMLRMAMAERSFAEESRQEAKRQIVLAEQEFVNAKRIRQAAQAEFDKAHALRKNAIHQISSTILQITCYACKHKFQAGATAPSQDE